MAKTFGLGKPSSQTLEGRLAELPQTSLNQLSAALTEAEGTYSTGPLGGEPDPSEALEEPAVVKTDEAAHAVATDDVTEQGYLGMELGPINEFTELRLARLAEEEAYLNAQIDRLEAQIIHLNKRRQDAVLALDGITVDRGTMDQSS